MWLNVDEKDLRKAIHSLEQKPGEGEHPTAHMLAVAHRLAEALKNYTRSERDLAYVKQAREEHHVDGECEVDDGAAVSVSDDGGAYVQAWVWVRDEEKE